MTISTTAASQLVSGNGIQTTFQYGFVTDSSADITVTSIATNGTTTVLNPSQYTLLINVPNPNQLWGIGGTVTYPLSGSPIAAGQQLLIQRTIPLTQQTSVQNQGNYFSQVTEEALDTLCMQIQQVSARTGQMRGTWATGISYNFGDVVEDGANGANTGNYYMCAIANTSGVWSTDLGNGDWSLVINIQNINAVVGAYLPLIGGTISGNLVVGGTINPSGGFVANTITNSALAKMNATTVKANPSGSAASPTDVTVSAPLSLGATTLNFNAQQLSNFLLSDVSLNSTGAFFTGPSIAQGTVGTWFASGNVTILDSAGAANFSVILWDGTSTIASTLVKSSGASNAVCVSLAGTLSSPAGNIKISVVDQTSVNGKIVHNLTGNTHDSIITAFRIG